MILKINLSEDKELRNAVLELVQDAVKTNIRDIVKNTQTDEVMEKLRKSIESSISIIIDQFEHQDIYIRFYDSIVNEIMNKININKIQKEIIQTVADRIYKQ